MFQPFRQLYSRAITPAEFTIAAAPPAAAAEGNVSAASAPWRAIDVVFFFPQQSWVVDNYCELCRNLRRENLLSRTVLWPVNFSYKNVEAWIAQKIAISSNWTEKNINWTSRNYNSVFQQLCDVWFIKHQIGNVLQISHEWPLTTSL